MREMIKRNSKWVIALSLVLVLTLGAVGSVSAAEFPKGETIPVGETIDDDVFISGENVVVDGVINGMLFASGATITINGSVTGDALLMGETIVLSKSAVIDGNLFIAGGDLTIYGTVTGSLFGGSADMELGSTANIGRNFYYGGFSLAVEDGSLIGRDLFVGAYQSVFSGDIGRDLAVGGAAIELNGMVGRNATFDVGNVEEAQDSTSFMSFNPYLSRYVEKTIEPGIRVSDSAEVGGRLTYTSSQNVNAALEAVTEGTLIYQTPVPYESQSAKYRGAVKEFDRGLPSTIFFGAAALRVARNFLKLMALGALALWLLAKPFKKLVEAAYSEPLKAIGWGFVLTAVGFLALFILPLAFVLVGLLIGFLSLGSLLYFWFGIIGTIVTLAFMLFFFAVFTASKLLAAYMFGKWLMKGLFKQEAEKPWINLLLGVFLYVLIRAIPVIGFLAALTATLIGTGAFWIAYIQKKAN